MGAAATGAAWAGLAAAIGWCRLAWGCWAARCTRVPYPQCDCTCTAAPMRWARSRMIPGLRCRNRAEPALPQSPCHRPALQSASADGAPPQFHPRRLGMLAHVRQGFLHHVSTWICTSGGRGAVSDAMDSDVACTSLVLKLRQRGAQPRPRPPRWCGCEVHQQLAPHRCSTRARYIQLVDAAVTLGGVAHATASRSSWVWILRKASDCAMESMQLPRDHAALLRHGGFPLQRRGTCPPWRWPGGASYFEQVAQIVVQPTGERKNRSDLAQHALLHLTGIVTIILKPRIRGNGARPVYVRG